MAIELALCDLNPPSVPWPSSSIASRTDAGVHANQNFLMAGLTHPSFPKTDYDEEQIVSTINDYMCKYQHEILIKSVHRISNNYFLMKPCIFREYKYFFYLNYATRVTNNTLPACDMDRFAEIVVHRNKSFSFEKMKTALCMMRGLHNFKSFEALQAHEDLHEWRRDTVREVTVCDARRLNMKTNSFLDHNYENVEVYEVTIRSSGFLYKQVRRMVGVAIMAALGELKLETLQFLLDYPHHWNWSDDFFTAPSEGLFLHRLCFKGLEEII